VVEDLMKVKAGQADKGTVFETAKAKFTEHFKQNEVYEASK
jgi:hypothetical protein